MCIDLEWNDDWRGTRRSMQRNGGRGCATYEKLQWTRLLNVMRWDYSCMRKSISLVFIVCRSSNIIIQLMTIWNFADVQPSVELVEMRLKLENSIIKQSNETQTSAKFVKSTKSCLKSFQRYFWLNFQVKFCDLFRFSPFSYRQSQSQESILRCPEVSKFQEKKEKNFRYDVRCTNISNKFSIT